MVQRPRATLKQIAKHCGVSHTTVSMVINNSPRISPETREKVLVAIKKFNYHPHAAARSLVMSRTNTIGLVGTMFASPYYNDIIHGIEMECRHLGLDIKIYNAEQTGADFSEAYDKIFGERSCDVIITISMPMNDEVVDRFQKEDMALVMLQPVLEAGKASDKVPTIFIDDKKGIYKAVSYLINVGHKRIGLLNGPTTLMTCRDRQEAYLQALKDHGLPSTDEFVATCNLPDPFVFEAGYVAANELYDKNPQITAVCCVSDPMALGAIKFYRQKGISVPDDMSVIGYDDTYIARLTDPALTTLHQPLFEMGKQAVTMAHAIVNNLPIQSIHKSFETELVVRESVKPATNA
jgi:LacI family transcriptional regulator